MTSPLSIVEDRDLAVSEWSLQTLQVLQHYNNSQQQTIIDTTLSSYYQVKNARVYLLLKVEEGEVCAHIAS